MKAIVGALCGALVIGAASLLAPAQGANVILDGTDWFGAVFSRTRIQVKPGVDALGSDWMSSMDISSGEVTFSASNWGTWSADIAPHSAKLLRHDFWLNDNASDLDSSAAGVISNTTGVAAAISDTSGKGYVNGRWDLSTLLMRQNARLRGFGMVQGQPRTFKGHIGIQGVLFLD
jgi:hypothetical protein